MDSNQQVSKRIKSLALLVASVLLIAGVFLPWVSISFSWLSTGGNRGNIHYSLNGIGFGQGSADIYYKNMTYNYVVNESWHNFSPQVSPFGVALIGVAIFNIFLALAYLDKKTQKVIPTLVKKKIKHYYSKLLLLEGVLSLGLTLIYTLFYFQAPVTVPFYKVNQPGIAGNPSHFQTSQFSLYEFYTHVFNYFSWILESSGSSKMVLNRSLGPGIGLYLTWFAIMLIIYTWYFDLIQKEDWPDIWRIRGVVAPLLGTLAFLPVMKIVSRTKGTIPSLLFSPLLHNFGGILYFLLTLGFFYFLRKSALTGKDLNKFTSRLYSREDLSTEELEELIQKVERLRDKSEVYKKYTGLFNVAILLTVGVIIASLIGYYITFIGEQAFGFKMMVNTFWNWILLLSPIVNTTLFILYR